MERAYLSIDAANVQAPTDSHLFGLLAQRITDRLLILSAYAYQEGVSLVLPDFASLALSTGYLNKEIFQLVRDSVDRVMCSPRCSLGRR